MTYLCGFQIFLVGYVLGPVASEHAKESTFQKEDTNTQVASGIDPDGERMESQLLIKARPSNHQGVRAHRANGSSIPARGVCVRLLRNQR